MMTAHCPVCGTGVAVYYLTAHSEFRPTPGCRPSSVKVELVERFAGWRFSVHHKVTKSRREICRGTWQLCPDQTAEPASAAASHH